MGGGGSDGAYAFIVCLNHFTVNRAPLLRRSTVPTPNRGTFDVLALSAFLPYE